MSDKCTQKVEELRTERKNGFSFNVKLILQLNLLSDIKSLRISPVKLLFINFQIKLKESSTYKIAKSMKNLKKKKIYKKHIHSSKTKLKRISISQGTLTLRLYFLSSTCRNSYILSISPDNHQIPLYTSTKTNPWYVNVIIATIADTQKPDLRIFY